MECSDVINYLVINITIDIRIEDWKPAQSTGTLLAVQLPRPLQFKYPGLHWIS